MVQLDAARPQPQRARGRDRVDGESQRAAGVVVGEGTASGLVVDDDELLAAVVARTPIDAVDASGQRHAVRARRHRALDADGVGVGIEARGVLRRHRGRAVAPLGGLTAVSEAVGEPAPFDEVGRRLRGAPGHGQQPPVAQSVVHGRAHAVVGPGRAFRALLQVGEAVAARAGEPRVEPGRGAGEQPLRHALEGRLAHPCASMKPKTPSATSSTAMAASSRPAFRVSTRIPVGFNRLPRNTE